MPKATQPSRYTSSTEALPRATESSRASRKYGVGSTTNDVSDSRLPLPSSHQKGAATTYSAATR